MNTFVAALLGCCMLGAQAPVDIPHDLEFPADECRLLGYINTKGGGDMPAMRRHAWYLFDQINRPVVGDSKPRWQTWYQWGDVLDSRPIIRPFRIKKPFELAEVKPPVLPASDPIRLTHGTGILYNPSAYLHLVNKCLGKSLQVYAACKTVPEFDRDAIALKITVVPLAECAALPVWDFDKGRRGAVQADSVFWPRNVLVASNVAACQAANPTARVFGLDSFYTVPTDPPTPGKVTVVVGIHVATREIKDWIWATFWWHDEADLTRYAEHKPMNLPGPSKHFLMTMSYDMDHPRESDGRPHIAYNPYLEGGLVDGVSSNCMTCHRRAAIPLQGVIPRYLASDGLIVLNQPFNRAVVRGQEASTVTYFDTPFAEKIKLSFLWSISADHTDNPLPPPPHGGSCPTGCPREPAGCPAKH